MSSSSSSSGSTVASFLPPTAGSLARFLANEFTTDQNTPQWDEIAGAIIGGLLLRFWEAVIGITTGVFKTIPTATTELIRGFRTGAFGAIDTVTGRIMGVIDPVLAGILSLPINVVVILVSIYLIGRATEAI